MSKLDIKPSGQACGAQITGLDLSRPLTADALRAVGDAWLEHHVLAFPDQTLTHDQLEAFALQFGEFGEDPYFNPLPGREHIAAVRREADETNKIFAEVWHSDWSFMAKPPSGTVLYAIDIPPHGGDTLFANQHTAFASMPTTMRARFAELQAIHSPKLGYSLKGAYGDVTKNGAMDIRPSAEAEHIYYTHPLVPTHPDSGKTGLFGGAGYIVGFEGASDTEAGALIQELNEWQSRPDFLYRHKWANNMLVMWDNRSVVHRATGGYEGYRRELHRITIY